MVLASYFTVRATEHASRGWLALAGVAIGFGFLTKMLQAFLVLPALVVAYAIAAPATWRKKIVDLLVAFAAMIVSAGWYVAVVELTPASLRPYIGGSQTQLPARADRQLQRPGPDHRQRGRLGGRRRGRRHVGLDRHPAHVRGCLRRHGLLADPGGAGARRRRVSCWRSPARAPGRLPTARRGDRASQTPSQVPCRRPRRVARLAGRHRRRVQLHGRHLPRLLHRGPGPGDRRCRRPRRRGAVGPPRTVDRRGCSLPAPPPAPALWALVLLQQAGGWYTVAGLGGRSASVRPRRLATVSRSDRLPRVLAAPSLRAAAIAAGLVGPVRLLGQHRGDRAHRLDRDRRPRHQRVRSRGGGPRTAARRRATTRPAPARRPAGPGTTGRRHRSGHRTGMGGLLNGAARRTELVTPARARTRPATPGWRRRSGPRTRPATSWPPASR